MQVHCATPKCHMPLVVSIIVEVFVIDVAAVMGWSHMQQLQLLALCLLTGMRPSSALSADNVNYFLAAGAKHLGKRLHDPLPVSSGVDTGCLPSTTIIVAAAAAAAARG